MKQLSIEEKAKRYDEAIEKLHEIITMDNKPVNPKEMGEYLFPELAESEDERIRKSILEHIQLCSESIPNRDIWIAWLEKQSEQNPAEWHIEDEQNLNACLGYISDELLRRWLKDVIHAKYDKPINKLEAKFHEGDWITIK